MEFIDIKVPVTIVNDLASCIDVGVEGADHLDKKSREAIELVANQIRTIGKHKIDSIEHTYKKLFVKGE